MDFMSFWASATLKNAPTSLRVLRLLNNENHPTCNLISLFFFFLNGFNLSKTGLRAQTCIYLRKICSAYTSVGVKHMNNILKF